MLPGREQQCPQRHHVRPPDHRHHSLAQRLLARPSSQQQPPQRHPVRPPDHRHHPLARPPARHGTPAQREYALTHDPLPQRIGLPGCPRSIRRAHQVH